MQREFVRQDDCVVLKEFLRTNSPTMDKLLADSKTAQVGAWAQRQGCSRTSGCSSSLEPLSWGLTSTQQALAGG